MPRLECLERRDVPATLTVDVTQVLRTVNTQISGTNLAQWDSNLNTTASQQMVQAAGLKLFRFPGGSSSDEFHFNVGPAYNGQQTAPTMATFIAAVGGGGMVTLDYGSADSKEAAAFLAYLNGSTSNTTSIGVGSQWNTTTSTWVAKDWRTAGYWAGLRAATPLAANDGLNFMRLGRAAPFGFHYFEIGNELYGSWETDHHGSGGNTGAAHDPATYIGFAKSFATFAAAIDPTISIGLATGSVNYDNNWTSNILTQSVAQGFAPGFLSDHIYLQGPGNESDSYLLHAVRNASQDANSPADWVLRANAYRNLLTQRLGATAGNNVELLATEFNSVYSNPGKQTTSLVNGLYTADSLGRTLMSGYNGANIWDLRNGWDTGNNNASGLYGWRQGGDYGLLGSGQASATASGANTPYPTYFAEQLISKIAHAGDRVVQSASNSVDRTIYAVKQANGQLDLLIINKDPTNDQTDQVQITGFQAYNQAQVWQYGKAQDTAQSQTTDGHSSLGISTPTLALNGANFSFTFPSYSMTVLQLTPATTTVLTAVNNPTTGGSLATVTATISPSPGSLGTVTFRDNGASLGTVNVSGNTATFQTSALISGPHPMTAVYSGAATFGGSTSNTLSFVVNGATTTTTLSTGTPNPATPSQSIAFTVTIAGGAATTGETVVLKEGGAIVATSGGTLTNGTATLTVAAGVLSVGTHNLVAAYGGNSYNLSSQSSAIAQVVARPQVVSITPNGNIPSLADIQHSRIASLQVTFNEPVQFDAGVLTLALHANGVAVGSVAMPDGYGVLPTSLQWSSADNTTWIATFQGNTDDGGDGIKSLKDGVYDFKLAAGGVHPLGAPAMSMAVDFTYTFFRLFGDLGSPTTSTDGAGVASNTATVTTTENLAFRGAFNAPTSYYSPFDFNGDGFINTTDNLEFRNRFNTPIKWNV